MSYSSNFLSEKCFDWLSLRDSWLPVMLVRIFAGTRDFEPFVSKQNKKLLTLALHVLCFLFELPTTCLKFQSTWSKGLLHTCRSKMVFITLGVHSWGGWNFDTSIMSKSNLHSAGCCEIQSSGSKYAMFAMSTLPILWTEWESSCHNRDSINN